MARIGYRRIRGYKYQLMEDYTHHIDAKPDHEIAVSDFITLSTSGELMVRKGYAWDGPSGPTIDTKSFMRGSLVHDVLYQLMREEQLDQSYRMYADELLRKICLEDGMWSIRAWYVYYGLRLFAKGAATPSRVRRNEMIYAP